MKTYGFDLDFFRTYKIQIRTGIQYTTHVSKSPQFHRDKVCKDGQKRERESAGYDRIGTDN